MSNSMTDEEIFAAALRIQAPPDRMAYLDQVCIGNADQRDRIARLLAALDDAGSFLNQPLADIAALGATAAAGESGGAASSNPAAMVSLDFLSPCDIPNTLGKLGPYIVEDVIGRGGMGIVLRAIDPKLNRVVAIKVLAPEFLANPMAGKRFLREAQAAAAVSHDHVVRIYAVDDASPVPFLVMECIIGQSLQQKIERNGILEIREILRIGNQIASGLAAAHKQGLVHRDIKPANILLENGIERVKITDFGLARAVDDVGITQSGQVTGTPQYMSPEQALGEPVDHRSDLFSLGSVLYTMCTGRPAFRATSTVAVLRRVVDDTPRPIREINPETPDWLIAIIDRLMSKRPDDRFQTAAEVATVLEQWLAHYQRPQTVPAPPRMVTASNASTNKPLERSVIRRAWDEWWSERDRWFAVSVQSILVLLHTLCMILFLSMHSSRNYQNELHEFKYQLGFPAPWFRLEIDPALHGGFHASFNLLTSSGLVCLVGFALYYAVWRIEKIRNPRPSGWNKPQVLFGFWALMAMVAVGVGFQQFYSELGMNRRLSSASPVGASEWQSKVIDYRNMKLLARLDPGRVKPIVSAGAGRQTTVTVQDGAWRIENTDGGDFYVLMDTVIGAIPSDGIVVCQAQIKVEAPDKSTWGGLRLGNLSPAAHRYPLPALFYEYKGSVPEWTVKEVRYPAKIFHTSKPPQIPIYFDLHGPGALWIKDLEVFHASEIQTGPSTTTTEKAEAPSPGVLPANPQPAKSAAVIEELRKQVDLTAQALKLAQASHNAQQTTKLELMTAERDWISAKLRLATAEGGASNTAHSLAQELVRLLGEQANLVRKQVESGVVSPTELNAVEKELSEARIHLLETQPDNPDSPSLPE